MLVKITNPLVIDPKYIVSMNYDDKKHETRVELSYGCVWPIINKNIDLFNTMVAKINKSLHQDTVVG